MPNDNRIRERLQVADDIASLVRALRSLGDQEHEVISRLISHGYGPSLTAVLSRAVREWADHIDSQT
ncbi:hypothetical protein [Hydrocarboniphaga effusa]|uniref:hypothetical protein n=1 Tax=Hydrocarboniphaga effusa TaxID=243629 RepID=UPI0035B135E7